MSKTDATQPHLSDEQRSSGFEAIAQVDGFDSDGASRHHNDEFFMARALHLAWKGRYTTMPNPRVGCVLVKDGKIVGEGWHERAGSPHAEINALRTAGGQAHGATAYVTLEPCSHHGRTGPCADALITAGVARLVVAMQDPNPEVSGRGLARCKAAGMEVAVGVGEQAAEGLNPGFISRMKRGIPFVRVKLASSLDGRTAMASGESQWITGTAARRDVQRIRARSSVILSGIESLLLDNSRLTVRADELGVPEDTLIHQPVRVVVDSTLRLPVNANVLTSPGRTLVVTRSHDAQRIQALIQAGAEILQQDGNGYFKKISVQPDLQEDVPGLEEMHVDEKSSNTQQYSTQDTKHEVNALPANAGRIDLKRLLTYLAAQEQCNELLVETGATLAGALFEHQLVDECVIYMAPTLLGCSGRPLLNLNITRMVEQQKVKITDMRAVGDDWRITLSPLFRTANA